MRYTADGRCIKELRQRRERRATQKEFAYEVRISERQLRKIENGNAALQVDVLERIASAFGVPWQDLVFASDQPRLVSGEVAGTPGLLPPARNSEPTIVPRFDTTYAPVAKDEADLFASAKGSHIVVSHVLTRLTSETEA